MAHFEIIKHPNGEFFFTLRATDGSILLSSGNGYRTKDNCKKSIESVRRNSADRTKFEVLRTRNGKTYFILKSINGRTIGTSEIFMGDTPREAAIRAVRNNAHRAKLVDTTKKESTLHSPRK